MTGQVGHGSPVSAVAGELRQLGQTLRRWHHEIVAWHQAQISNGPTEAPTA
jgi:transposase